MSCWRFRTSGYPVGRLALRDRRIWFQYDPSFIARQLQLSPFKLPLKSDIVTSESPLFDGLFGLFNDSLPDGWGRLLLDRSLRAIGIAPETLTVLDRLAQVGRHGMGALMYEPDYGSVKHAREALDLDHLAKESAAALSGASGDVLAELLSLNGSSSGARPKIMAGVSKDKKRIIHGVSDLPDGYEHWLIKFTSSHDANDNGAIEYAYSRMAKAAGIEMPETFLFPASKGPGYFGVKRFDRRGNSRLHVHTVSGLLHADHRLPSLDYESILKAAMALTRSMPDVETLYRQAIFNVLAHNRDDHAKNMSFLMEPDGEWHAAPAYDLVFSAGPAGEHCTTVMGEGKHPGRRHLQQLGRQLELKNPDALIDKVATAVSRWISFAKEADVTAASRRSIQRAIGS